MKGNKKKCIHPRLPASDGMMPGPDIITVRTGTLPSPGTGRKKSTRLLWKEYLMAAQAEKSLFGNIDFFRFDVLHTTGYFTFQTTHSSCFMNNNTKIQIINIFH